MEPPSQPAQRQGQVKNEQEMVCRPEDICMAFLDPVGSSHPSCGLIPRLSRGLALQFLCSIFVLQWKAGKECLELKYLSSCLFSSCGRCGPHFRKTELLRCLHACKCVSFLPSKYGLRTHKANALYWLLGNKEKELDEDIILAINSL